MRRAVPALSLPVEMADDKLHDQPAVTRNVSANGVLLELTGPINVGEELDFHLRMPGSVLGTPQDVYSSLSWTCGTLLHKPRSVSGCCYYR